MYLETLLTLVVLIALIGAHWMRRRWGLIPFHIFMSLGLFCAISGAIVPSDSYNGVGFSSTVLIGCLLVLFLDGPAHFRRTLSAMGLMAAMVALVRLAATTLPSPPSMFGSLTDSLSIVAVGSLVFLLKAGLVWAGYRLMFASNPKLASLFGLLSLTLADVAWVKAMGIADWTICWIHFGLSGPLVMWYVNYGLIKLKQDPPPPLPQAQLSLLSIFDHQLHNDTPAALKTLLQSIYHAIPQAEALSLCVRKGERFRIVAQWGHQDELLGVEFGLGNFMIWHGNPQSWERGEARIVSGRAYQKLTQLADAALDHPNLERLQGTDKHRSIRSNLGFPILQGHSVIGYLNLDSFSSDRAFDSNTMVQLQPFIAALRAIIQTKERRAIQGVLDNLNDTLLTLHRALRLSNTLDEAIEQFLQISMGVFAAQHGMVSLVSEDGQELKSGVARGFFANLKGIWVPEGIGLGWAALRSGKIIRSNDVKNDLRTLGPNQTLQPSTAQLTVPLYRPQGQPLGVLYLNRDHPRMFDEVDVEVMAAIADVAYILLGRWAGPVQANRVSQADRADEVVLV
jgi:GAF domain-containing protein